MAKFKVQEHDFGGTKWWFVRAAYQPDSGMWVKPGDAPELAAALSSGPTPSEAQETQGYETALG